ncbi:hypothetical protein Aau02nite_26710 [Amorphoplanes auranticolor]|uniref:Uncharacterized protein n=1 Tax=Actinoplanes auranticolor TaxID=47988 RepID=A0A919S854_9ACTN|nr:hypothetical protein Aau02nite_26710 [Actinoplanes auranticolor]
MSKKLYIACIRPLRVAGHRGRGLPEGSTSPVIRRPGRPCSRCYPCWRRAAKAAPRKKPDVLVADMAYAHDPTRRELRRRGIATPSRNALTRSPAGLPRSAAAAARPDFDTAAHRRSDAAPTIGPDTAWKGSTGTTNGNVAGVATGSAAGCVAGCLRRRGRLGDGVPAGLRGAASPAEPDDDRHGLCAVVTSFPSVRATWGSHRNERRSRRIPGESFVTVSRAAARGYGVSTGSS